VVRDDLPLAAAAPPVPVFRRRGVDRVGAPRRLVAISD
jgi:hypothetical protein